MIENTRKCTMCTKPFTQMPRRGRPEAFCSDACKAASRTNPIRKCIICGTPFNKSNGPFYCSAECKDVRGLCAQCGKPSETKFCSHACLQQQLPPPYNCRQCKRQFMPSERWLAYSKSLRTIPRYCSAECFSASKGITQQATMRSTLELHSATTMYSISNELPTNNGVPYWNAQPNDGITLNARDQHTVDFWRYVLKQRMPTMDINTTSLWIVYSMLIRGVLLDTKETSIPPAIGHWPWIRSGDVANLPNTDMRTMQQAMNAYRYLLSIQHRQHNSKTQPAMLELLQRAEAAHHAWESVEDLPEDMAKTHERFRKAWLVKKPEYGNLTRLHLEARAYTIARRQPPDELLTAAWQCSPTVLQQIKQAHDELSTWAREQFTSSRKQNMPWGPRYTPAMAATMLPNRFNELLDKAALFDGFATLSATER